MEGRTMGKWEENFRGERGGEFEGERVRGEMKGKKRMDGKEKKVEGFHSNMTV